MSRTIEIPDTPSMKTRKVPLFARGQDEPVGEAVVTAPASLADAVALDGEEGVFRKYLLSVAQAQKQKARNKEKGGHRGRRSLILEEFGL